MALKRKAVLRIPKASQARGSKVEAEPEEHAEEEVEEETTAPARKMMKKPAAAASSKQDEAEEEGDEEAEEEEEEEVNEEELAAQREEEQAAARKKELKGLYMDDLKKIVTAAGLETGKKEDMVTAVLAHEADLRAQAKAKAESIRAVVVKKKEELEGMPLPELKELCNSSGLKGNMPKPERVSKLLAIWQEDDGVDKALAQLALDKRKSELTSKDPEDLLKLCDTAGVDAFVKEVMVERLVKKEHEEGRYAPPTLAEKEEADAPAVDKKKGGDMVEALLAKESSRKQEQEAKRLEAEAAANKKKEIKSMSVEDLKKVLSKKGRDTAGKKDDLVEAVFAIKIEEEAEAKKRKELLGMPLAELKNFIASKKIEVKGGKNQMVDAFFAHEAKVLEDARAHAAKVEEVLAKQREELSKKSASELKELCASKGLKLGLSKDDRLETLLEDAKKSGEVDKVLVGLARDARKAELLAMEKDALRELCDTAGTNALVKEVMVERILAHESEVGAVVEEPATKKARKAK